MNSRQQPIYPIGYRPRYTGMSPSPQGVAILRAFVGWDQYIAGARRTAEMDIDIYNQNTWEDQARQKLARWKLKALEEPWRKPVDWIVKDEDDFEALLVDEAEDFAETLSYETENARLALTKMMRMYPSMADGVINVGCSMCSNDFPQHKCQACDKALCGQVCFDKHACD